MQTMKPVRSFGYFLHKLRSISTIKLDVFKDMFSTYRDALAVGLGYYRSRRAESNAKENLMKDVGIDDTMANFIVDVSELLDLDLRQSYDLFCAYLLYDYAGPMRDVKGLMDDSNTRKAILAEMEKFIYREQISLLLSIIEILKIVQRSQEHTSHVVILENFVADKLALPAFVDSVLVSLNNIWTKEIESKTFSSGFRLDPYFRAISHIALQKHLVILLIWLFSVSDLPIDCYVGVIKLFAKQNFGRKQFYGKLLPSYEADIWINEIFCLETLFALQSFHLDSLLAPFLDETREKDSFWLDQTKSRSLDSIFEDLISPNSHDYAVLALAYALNIQLRRSILARELQNVTQDIDAVEDATVQKFGFIARRDDCLKVLVRLLENPAITDDEDIQALARGTVYIALDGCLQFFEAASLGSVDDLMVIFYNVLRDASTADAFWLKEFSSGASYYILNDVIYQLFANFQRPLRILSVLASASLDSCRKVVKLLVKLPAFSEPVENIQEQELTLQEDDMDDATRESAVVLLKPRQPFGNDGPLLPTGTVGRLVVGPQEFVQWEFSYNAWQLLLLEITKSKSNTTVASSVFSLIAEILKLDPSTATMFVHFLNEAVDILKRVRYFEADLWISLLEPCYRCLAAAAKSFPYEIITQIATDDILPSLRPLAEGEFHICLLTRILNDVERLSGTYDCTVAFLNLVDACCNEINNCCDVPVLPGSISYICDIILPDCLSWPYEKEIQKNEIVKLCLQICRKILEKTSVTDGISSNVKSVLDICRNSLTFGESRRTVLRLACLGTEIFRDTFVGFDGRTIIRNDIVEIVSYSLALLLELLIDYERTKKDAQTPPVFTNLFLAVASATTADEGPPLRNIGRYLLLRTDSRIPKLAIICLKKIAKIFPATLLSTLGEWTSAFCDAFLTRLESPIEDVQLKVYCIEFLTVAVRHQPGLAEKLLGISSDSEVIDVSKVGQVPVVSTSVGALDCVLSLMKSDRLLPDLAIACVNLFFEIWRTKTTLAMDYLRKTKKDDFWSVLMAPLSTGEENYFLTIVSPVVRILARELFLVSTTNSVSKTKDLGGANGKIEENSAVVLSVVKEIMRKDRIKLTFKKFGEYCGSRVDSKEKVETLEAWTEFCQVVFANKTTSNYANDDTKEEILLSSANILKISLDNFDGHASIPVVKASSDLCNLALKYCLWSGNISRNKNIVKNFESIIHTLNDSFVEEWCQQLSAIVIPTCCPIFGLETFTKEDAESLPVIFDSLCSVLIKIIIQTATLRSKNLLSSTAYPWAKALSGLLRCLAIIYPHLATIIPEEETEDRPVHPESGIAGRKMAAGKRALGLLQKHSVLRNLRVLCESLLPIDQLDPSLFSDICLLFQSVARSPDSLVLINHSGFLEWICVKLVVSLKPTDLDTLIAVVGVHLSLLQAGAYRAVTPCTTFLASYSDIIVQLMFFFPTNFAAKNAAAIIKILQLLVILADHKERWSFEALDSQDVMKDALRLLCFRLPPFLSKPAALTEIITKQERMTVEAKQASDTKVGSLQQRLIEIMFYGVQFLLRFSPELIDVCNNPSFDSYVFPPLLALDLNTNLAPSIPSLADDMKFEHYENDQLTFGAVLLIVNLCVNSLRKSEMARSASPSVHRTSVPPLFAAVENKSIISSLLDSALYLLLSQASLYFRRGDFVDAWQHALLKRDLAGELSQYLSRCGIRTTGSGSTTPRKSPTPALAATSPGTVIRTNTAMDYEFLKFVSDFVRDVLRNND